MILLLYKVRSIPQLPDQVAIHVWPPLTPGQVEWADTPDDSDRKRRRQAEFLVHHFFPWNLISQIGVVNAEMKERVERLLTGAGHRPPVHVRQQWYYQQRTQAQP
jgi:ssDNA thymidine ADP-ribosyltransferase DarT-like protein